MIVGVVENLQVGFWISSKYMQKHIKSYNRELTILTSHGFNRILSVLPIDLFYYKIMLIESHD